LTFATAARTAVVSAVATEHLLGARWPSPSESV